MRVNILNENKKALLRWIMDIPELRLVYTNSENWNEVSEAVSRLIEYNSEQYEHAKKDFEKRTM
jgi:hypothetical protein